MVTLRNKKQKAIATINIQAISIVCISIDTTIGPDQIWYEKDEV